MNTKTIYRTEIATDGRSIKLEYHEPYDDFDVTQITNVLLMAFDSDGNILAIGEKNGLDIPSGHVEWDDDTFLDTARRIAYERLGVELGDAALSTLVVSKANNGFENHISYMPVVTAQTKSVRSFVPTKTASHRVFIDRYDMLNKWHVGKREDMLKLLEMAEPTLARLGQNRRSSDGRCS